jgi:hypothetical protein
MSHNCPGESVTWAERSDESKSDQWCPCSLVSSVGVSSIEPWIHEPSARLFSTPPADVVPSLTLSGCSSDGCDWFARTCVLPLSGLPGPCCVRLLGYLVRWSQSCLRKRSYSGRSRRGGSRSPVRKAAVGTEGCPFFRSYIWSGWLSPLCNPGPAFSRAEYGPDLRELIVIVLLS